MTNQDLLNLIAANPDIQTLYDAGNDVGVANALNDSNRATIQKPAPLSVAIVFGTLSEASLGRLSTHPSCEAIRQSLLAEDRVALIHWATLLAARPSGDATSIGTITMAERDALIAYVQSTTAQPASLYEVAQGAGQTVSRFQIFATRPQPAVPVLTTVTVTVPASLVVGSEAQATASALDQNGAVISGKTVSLWQGHDLDIVAVFENGKLQARGVGTTTVLAHIDGVVGQASITVTH